MKIRYQEFLEVILKPANEDYEKMVTWAGGPFHAEEFNVTAVNSVLSSIRFPMRHRG